MARVVFCESCGAPLDAPWKEIAIVCQYCGAQSVPGKPGQHVPSSIPADGRPRLNIDGRTYLVEGRIARGDSCDVFRARWVRRLGELVVIKVLRAKADADLLRREKAFLDRLHASRAQGVEHFATLLPRPIALGPVVTERHGERLCLVMQWHPGFVHTLVDVGHTHPKGVDGPIVVWIAKRLLELLAWVHSAGVVHGAVIPEHVLVHPRDHGALLVGWSTACAATRDGYEKLLAYSQRNLPFYTEESVTERVVNPTLDVQMAARCALAVWGEHPGEPKIPDAVTGPVAKALRAGARGEFGDAWSLRERIDEASRDQFGPPKYSPLAMPGWAGR